jgi:outer membrane protein
MALRNSSRAAAAFLALLAVAPLAGQARAPEPLTFAAAVQRAAGTAPLVALAGLRTDEASARVRQARSALLPSLDASAFWLNRSFNSHSIGISFPGFPTLIGPFNNYDARLHGGLTLFSAATFKRVGAARAQLTSAQADAAVAAEGSAQAAAVAYLRAARAAAVVAARRADSTVAAELLALALAQKAAGVSSAIDVTRARTQLVTSENALLVAVNQAERGRIDLARALGLDPTAPLVLADTLRADLATSDVPVDRDGAVARALAGRPDLQAEAARGNAARQARAAISAERLPRLDVGGDYGVNGLTAPKAIGTTDLQVQVSVPLFDGFRREGRIAEQSAVAEEAAVRERDLRQQVAADVQGALLDLNTAQAQQAIAAERLQLAQDELTQARQRFAAGVAGNIEVIDAESSLLRARDGDIDARFAAAAARVALARAVGAARTLH